MLLITELAIAADGKYAVEIANTGTTTVNLSGQGIFFETSDNAGQFGVSFSNLGLIQLAPGTIITVGHSSLAGVGFSNASFDQVFDPGSLGVGLAGVYIRDGSFNTVDHFGVRAGSDLGSDRNYSGLLDRSAKTDREDDNTADFSETTPYSNADFGSALCFAAGTMIASPGGEVAVDSLAVGDTVLTADGRAVPVRWIGRQTAHKLLSGPRMQPVRIRAGALGGGLPHSDLTVTADHGMIIDGLVINAAALVNGGSIDWVPLADLPDRVTYYHVETEDHDVILANGAAAETFIDYVGRQAFDNYDEYLGLYGAERIIPEMDRPRISAQRLVPEAIKVRLGIPAEPTFDWDDLEGCDQALRA